MNLKKNSFPILIAVIFALVMGGVYYFLKDNKADEVDEQQVSESTPDNGKGRYQLNSNTISDSKRSDAGAQDAKETLSSGTPHASSSPSDDDFEGDDETSKQMEKVFKGYIKEVYSDLFDDLNLNADTRKALTSHLAKSHQYQQKISMMLLDENLSDEEILAKQSEYDARQEQDLKKIMPNADQQQKIKQYNDRLPMKIAGEAIDMSLEGIKDLNDSQKKDIREIMLKHDFASNNVATQLAKNQGNPTKAFTPENIAESRDLVSKTAKDDPEPLKGIVKEMETTNSQIAKDLRARGLPKHAIDAAMKDRYGEVSMIKSAIQGTPPQP